MCMLELTEVVYAYASCAAPDKGRACTPIGQTHQVCYRTQSKRNASVSALRGRNDGRPLSGRDLLISTGIASGHVNEPSNIHANSPSTQTHPTSLSSTTLALRFPAIQQSCCFKPTGTDAGFTTSLTTLLLCSIVTSSCLPACSARTVVVPCAHL